MEKNIDTLLYIAFMFVVFLALLVAALVLFKVITEFVKHWDDEGFWE